MPNKFYLTTPIYYVNARPHIGHAYSTIAADVIARRHRLLGDDTFFLTGTDEHGQKVQRSAAAAGIPPQQFTDEVSASFQNLWKRMGILDDSLSKNDPLLHRDYIRTTDERHKRGVQHLWRELEARGAIYLSSYTGQYCVSDEAFVDVPVGAPCPTCGRITETITEENYFFKLSEYQERLINLIESGELHIQPEQVRNEVLSFVRGGLAPGLEAHRKHTGIVDIPDAYSSEEIQSALESGFLKKSEKGHIYSPGALKDLSISRTTFDWGIPVPTNPKHVIYVWLDALANYITAIGYGSDDPAEQAKFKRYWPADLHLVGKEITRFHCVYWPAFLMAAGIATPKSVVANGWLLFEESKMSKSRGNVVRTETILDAFGPLCPPVAASVSLDSTGLQPGESGAKEEGALAPGTSLLAAPTKAQQDLFAADVLRYFLLREIPFGQDGTFSFDALITRYNADLANGYGNLVSRTLALVQQNFDGIIPSENLVAEEPTDEWTPLAIHVAQQANDIAGDMNPTNSGLFLPLDEYWNNFELSDALRLIVGEIATVDGFLTYAKPWKLAKSDDAFAAQHLRTSLYTAAESIRIITALLYPVMPYATASVWRQLGLGSIEEVARNGELKNLQWGGLKPGTKLGPLAPIFPRADKELAQIMTDMENPTTPPAPTPTPEAKSSEPTAEALNAVNPGTSASPIAPSTSNLVTSTSTISIDDFAKIDLRVAEIVVAERIPKADKLLRLEVDLGPGFDPPRRQILAGIAEYYAPETLIGRKVVIVANLAPRKMRGLESQGMIVAAAVGPNGAPVLAGFLEDVEIGSRLK
jgi:methionyl-tRNA synthetase